MKKTLLASAGILAALATTPAFAQTPAWDRAKPPYVIINHTDPMTITGVGFGLPNVKAVLFPLYVPATQWRLFGPLPEDGGSCIRNVWVHVHSDFYGDGVFPAPTAPIKMNVCTETHIEVTGEWPGVGAWGIVIKHWK